MRIFRHTGTVPGFGLICLILTLLSAQSSAMDWDLVVVEGRQYVTADRKSVV